MPHVPGRGEVTFALTLKFVQLSGLCPRTGKAAKAATRTTTKAFIAILL